MISNQTKQYLKDNPEVLTMAVRGCKATLSELLELAVGPAPKVAIPIPPYLLPVNSAFEALKNKPFRPIRQLPIKIGKLVKAKRGRPRKVVEAPTYTVVEKPKPQISAAGRERIAAAQRARWAKIHAAKARWAKQHPDKLSARRTKKGGK